MINCEQVCPYCGEIFLFREEGSGIITTWKERIFWEQEFMAHVGSCIGKDFDMMSDDLGIVLGRING